MDSQNKTDNQAVKKEDEAKASPEQTPGQADSKSADASLKVNKKGFIEVDGEIIESLPSITFRVMLENGQEIMARLSGKMRMYKIMLLPGDKVKIEMSPYDLTKGRITYRY